MEGREQGPPQARPSRSVPPTPVPEQAGMVTTARTEAAPGCALDQGRAVTPFRWAPDHGCSQTALSRRGP